MQQASQFDREWLEQKYTVERLSAQKIADLVGAKIHQVYAALRRHGIRTRPRGYTGRGKNMLTAGEEGFILALHLQRGAKMSKSSTHDWYTAKEVADKLEVSVTTIGKMIKRGNFPGSYKINPDLINSPYRIPKASFEKFLKEQRGKATK